MIETIEETKEEENGLEDFIVLPLDEKDKAKADKVKNDKGKKKNAWGKQKKPTKDIPERTFHTSSLMSTQGQYMLG